VSEAVAADSAPPVIAFRPGLHRRAFAGHPWVYANEIEMDQAAKALAPGSVVRLAASDGRNLGLAFFNPHSLIAARLLTPDGSVAIDRGFLAERLGAAATLRDRLYDRPYYRLVHAEADGLPGLVIDRYADAFALQLNSAGMDRLEAPLLAALEDRFAPTTIVLRNDSPARAQEGLDRHVRVVKGMADHAVEIEESGARFLADLGQGQKTGWFYDQRDNRAAVAKLAGGLKVLDLYCYTGGFAVMAAMAGAASVLAIDESEAALALGLRAAALNGVAGACAFRRGEVFRDLGSIAERFDLVIADPPAFVKSRKGLPQGLRAYRKLARLAAGKVNPGGFLFLSSCSHAVEPAAFAVEVARGLHDTGRAGRILKSAGAGLDHPVHPMLPETAYLKSLLLQVD
jgi:23S rRNA (cytosine1962-C5)-methyltransferase